MLMEMLIESVSTEEVAVIAWDVEPGADGAVPLTTPVVASSESPDGNGGDTDQVTEFPVESEYEKEASCAAASWTEVGPLTEVGSRTSISRDVESVPLLALAWIVYVVWAEASVGVPLMTPVAASSERPAGRAG